MKLLLNKKEKYMVMMNKMVILCFVLFTATLSFSQKDIPLIYSHMKITEFPDTLPRGFNGTFLVINYKDSLGNPISQMGYDSIGNIVYYNIGSYGCMLNRYGLSRVEWSNGKLVRLKYYGPLFEHTEFFVDSLGSTHLIFMDSLGHGFGSVHDSLSRLIASYNFSLGSARSYYESGQVETEYYWDIGYKIMVGKFVRYFESGSIAVEGSFLDRKSSISFNNKLQANENISVKDGEWKYYRENGKLDYIEIWREGVLISTRKGKGGSVSN